MTKTIYTSAYLWWNMTQYRPVSMVHDWTFNLHWFICQNVFTNKPAHCSLKNEYWVSLFPWGTSLTPCLCQAYLQWHHLYSLPNSLHYNIFFIFLCTCVGTVSITINSKYHTLKLPPFIDNKSKNLLGGSYDTHKKTNNSPQNNNTL